jgi:hypothetical protein
VISAEPAAGGRRRTPIIIGAVVLAAVLLGGAAFAAWRLWPMADVNPAERLPDSAVFYAELNLDPRHDQTTNLLRLLERFDALDDATDVDTVIADLLAELDLDGVETDDITRWLGPRGAAAAWADPATEDFTFALALASRNDRAARNGLAAILEASDEEFGYVVESGLAVLVFTETDPQDRAEELVADGRAAPLADSAAFQSSLESLGGDHLALMWINLAEIAAVTDEAIAFAGASSGLSFEELYGFYEMGSAVVGIQATDVGFEVRYHADGTQGTLPDRSDWLDRLGQLRTSQVAAMVTLPEDLHELTKPIYDGLDDLYVSPLAVLDDYHHSQWDYELTMTAEELTEFDELYFRWDTGDLVEGDDDFDRFLELEDQYWSFGPRAEYDGWIAGGNTHDDWWLEYALTDEEFEEFLLLEELFYNDELDDDAVQRFFQLDYRFYGFGLASLYGFEEIPFDPLALMAETYALASGATFTVVLGDVFGESEFGISLELATGPAEQLLDLPLPNIDELVAGLGDEFVLDGNTVAFGDLTGAGGALAEHPRFADAFADSPDQAFLAVFVDVEALNSATPEPAEWLEPVSVVSLVQGADGTGVLRVLID